MITLLHSCTRPYLKGFIITDQPLLTNCNFFLVFISDFDALKWFKKLVLILILTLINAFKTFSSTLGNLRLIRKNNLIAQYFREWKQSKTLLNSSSHAIIVPWKSPFGTTNPPLESIPSHVLEIESGSIDGSLVIFPYFKVPLRPSFQAIYPAR